MGLPIIGDGDGGGGNIRHPCPEHSCTVHCDHTRYGYVSGVRAAPWSAGVPEVVGTGKLGPGGMWVAERVLEMSWIDEEGV